MRRVRAKIRLTDTERLSLKTLSRKKSVAHSLVQRATIILLAEEMDNNTAVAEKLSISTQTVAQWTHRWVDLTEEGKEILERLADAPRSGKPASVTPEQLCKLIALACDNPENYGRPISHWTQSELTDEAIKQNIFSCISSRHVGRLLAKLALRPHKHQYWLHRKVDELREQKIAEICSIYKDAEALKKKGHCYLQYR